MTVLRRKMIENMQLRGLSVRTQESYVQAVSQLARHYHKPPDQIVEEELRLYFLYLKTVRHVSRSTQTIALCGIKFFYEHTLEHTWHTLDLIRPPKENKLPVVLSVEEAETLKVSETFRVSLESMPGVTTQLKVGDKTRLYTEDPSALIPRVVQYAEERDLRLISLNTLGPSLEDVFLEITGGQVGVAQNSVDASEFNKQQKMRGKR